jgi:hypothetical protein
MDSIGNVKITALMTAGRYENTWCRNQIDFALRELGIPMTISGGVYYGQCMQKMLEDAIEAGIEYAVTIDGDSVFTAKQLQRLISIAYQERETINAICGMQMRRGQKTMLGTKDGKTVAAWDGYPIELDTAHFGLTLIDLSKLSSVAKPWFFCQPNADGEWDGNKIDSDVWFWRQWRAAGNTIYMDPETRLGHLEEVIAVHDDDLKPTHIYPADWAKFCKGQVTEELETVLGWQDC